MRRMLAVVLGVACLPAISWGEEWAQFRGPNVAALAEGKNLPTEWSKDKNVQWKVDLPGAGWSSPIVWGDKVFVTTAVTENQTKPKPFSFGGRGGMGPGGFRRGRGPGGGPDGPPGGPGGPPPGGFGGGPPGGFRRGGFGPGGMGTGGPPPNKIYRWEVYCLDRETGKVIWKKTATEHKPTIPTHSSNTYASETPICDGERIYVYFGMTGLYCYDLDGKLLWSKETGSYPMMAGWGTGSSPTLEGDRLFLQCDNEKQSFLAAFDKKTGKELWKVDRDEKSSWSTPYIWRNKERTELVTCGGRRVRSYDPATGKVLWELAANGQGNASPVGDAELLYVGSGGFGNRPLFAVRAGASGDVSLKNGEKANAGVAWSRTQAGPSMASPLLYQGYLYILEQNGGILSCYDAKTGKQEYKERLSQAKGFTASPWGYDGKVFCLDEDGKTFVVEAGAQFKLLGKNPLGEMFWSSPAIAGGALFLRGVDHLYCIKPADAVR